MTALLYVLLFTALVTAAAAAAEWGVQGRMPARHFWSLAIVLALGAPPAIIAVRARQHDAVAITGVTAAGSADLGVYVVNGARQTARATGNAGRLRALGRQVRSVERLVMSQARSPVIRHVRTAAMVLWALASVTLLGWILAGVLHWRRERRTWEPATVDGITVELSPSTGPAVLGLVTQRIVLPSWATTMEPRYRTLMLAHECEHIRAGDPQRLALALGALVLMPWNAALWWAVARLRRAIELDCDARVLRAHPAPKAYGYLLLEVAARGRNTGALAMPLVGLLRLPSELETRLRAMTRPRTIARRTLVCAGVLAIGALGTAFMAPVPRAMGFDVASIVRPGPTGPDAPQGRTIVHVGSARLALKGATYAPGRRTVRGTVTSLARDTVPNRTRDSIAKLNHALDSMRVKLRQLEQQRVTIVRELPEPDSAPAGTLPEARFRVMVLKPTDSARRPGPTTWFVRDSSGRVIHTSRVESGIGGALDADAMTKQFPEIRSADIATINIRKHSPGAGTEIWITLKR